MTRTLRESLGVQILHQMRSIGMMKLEDFKGLLIADQYAKVFRRMGKVLGKFSHWKSLHNFFTRYVLFSILLYLHVTLFYNDVSKLVYLFFVA